MSQKIRSPFPRETYQRNAQIYKLLANPKRLEILNLLARHELTVTQLVEIIGLKKANISQHLAVLHALKIVQSRREGKYVHYSITDKKIISPCKILSKLWKNESRIHQTKQ